MILTNKQSKLLTLVALFTIAIIQALYMLWTPWQCDDLWFLSTYLEYNDYDPSFDLGKFIETRLFYRETDNGRLANDIDLLVVLTCPRWLFAIVTGIITAGLFYLMSRLVIIIAGDDTRPLMPVLVVMLWGMISRYVHYRFLVSFADLYLNYFYSAFFILLTILTLNKAAESPMHKWQLVCSILAAFIAGWFHEGLSAPLMAGIGLWACIKRFRLPLQWWAIAIAFTFGFLIVITAPGIHLRAERTIWENVTDWGSVKFSFEYSLKSAIVFAVLFIFIALTPKGRRLYHPFIKEQPFILLIVTYSVAIIITIITPPSVRAAWLPNIISFVILSIITIKLMPWWRQILPVALLIGLIVYIFNVATMADDLKFRHATYVQSNDINRLFDTSPYGTVFVDVPEFENIYGKYIHIKQFDNCFNIFCINNIRNDSTKLFTVVPKALAQFKSIDTLNTIAGSLGACNFNGYYLKIKPDAYRVDSLIYSDDSFATAEMTDNTILKVRLIQKTFMTADGQCAIWYRFEPEITKPIKKIDYDPVVRR